MGWDDWRWERRAPIERPDGIKAQTQRGQFGKSWWASRWIAALERLVDYARLSRGRSYARRGQVVELNVGIDGVAARVQGSRPSPYKVRIRFRPLPEEEWDAVVDAIAAEAIYAAKLLSGEMPADIEKVFEAAGASLFPAARGDLETDCSCPDWANPCKHVAAVHYLLGERFDSDPFLIFEMRGMGKDAITAALRARRSAGRSPEAAAELGAGDEEEQEEVAVPLADCLVSFWSAPADVLDMAMHFSPPPVDALLVKRLGAPAFWQGKQDFMALMEEAYKRIGDQAFRLVIGEE